ncbi:MAG: hypothetical protein IKU47_08220 [Oscillospiraceae bacterium]|nr:hypothetical protein [Oscillospiraceae bacterium]
MSIDLKQFAGASVTPADDARLYNFFLSGRAGIAEGVEVTHLGANQFRISAGWGVCKGRVFVVAEETVNAKLSPSGSQKGRLIISVDLSADIPAYFASQTAATLPDLVQEDLNGSGTLFEIPLAEYTCDEIQCSDVTDARVILEVAEVSVQRAQATADAAMPRAGGEFAGEVSAIETNRTGYVIRNCGVVSSDGSAFVSTNRIRFQRK